MFADVRHVKNAVNLLKKGFAAVARKRQTNVFAKNKQVSAISSWEGEMILGSLSMAFGLEDVLIERRLFMGCGSCTPKKMAKYVCSKCGKEEMREAKEGEEVKSCCGQIMKIKGK